jgi:hypothetical protein
MSTKGVHDYNYDHKPVKNTGWVVLIDSGAHLQTHSHEKVIGTKEKVHAKLT